MKIPLLDLREQYKSIKSEIDSALKDVIDNQAFVLGSDVSELEKETALYCNTKYAVGLASGTDALILSLKALGVKEGDEVITTPFTFFATAEAVSIVGARPVFVDIDPRTYNINPGLIEKAINKKTRAIIPVHLYGQCADMDAVMSVARKHDLKVVEDAAQAIGAAYKGRPAGSMGDIGALSFFPSKNLGGFGDGGMIVTNDRDLADKVRVLRVHGSSERYIHSDIGTNSRLDNLQAAVLRVKLRYLNKWLEARRKNAKYYDDNLKGLPVTTPFVPDCNVHTYHQYTLRVRSNLRGIMEFLNSGGVEARTYYPIPLHLQECYRGLGYRKGDLKESEEAALQVFSIGVYPELKKAEQDHVIGLVKDFFKR